MAIHNSLKNKFRKYIPQNEQILATIYCDSPDTGRSQRVCITEKRMALLERKGVLAWNYISGSFSKIYNVKLNQGFLSSEIIIYFRDGYQPILSNVNKSDARDFVALLSSCIEQDNELLSQRTKVCPECDEIVKFKANRCKHCGNIF